MKIVLAAVLLSGGFCSGGFCADSEKRVELLQKMLDRQQKTDLQNDLASLRKATRDSLVSYREFRQWVWNILVFRNYPDPPIRFRTLGTTRSEIRRLLEEKRRLMPEEYRQLREWRDKEIEVYLRSIDFAQ